MEKIELCSDPEFLRDLGSDDGWGSQSANVSIVVDDVEYKRQLYINGGGDCRIEDIPIESGETYCVEYVVKFAEISEYAVQVNVLNGDSWSNITTFNENFSIDDQIAYASTEEVVSKYFELVVENCEDVILKITSESAVCTISKVSFYKKVDAFDETPSIYLTIPANYSCVYFTLINSLSIIGDQSLKDCKVFENKFNKEIIKLWNMFQTACAAYYLEEISKSDTIINYIKYQIEDLYKGLNLNYTPVNNIGLDEDGNLFANIYCKDINSVEVDLETGCLNQLEDEK